MAGLRPVLSFLVILAAALAALRLVHVGAGSIRPEVVTGAVSVASLDGVERAAGFAPIVPYYRPRATGVGHPSISVHRRERVTVEIAWRSARELVLREWRGDRALDPPPGALTIEGAEESALWSSDSRVEALVRIDGTWVHLSADLPEHEVQRVVATLRPR